MKKYIKSSGASGMKAGILLVIVFGYIGAIAQQSATFSTYYFNKFLNNPAFTGIDNEYRAFGFYRTQWSEIPGSPVTGGATFEGSFWKDRIGAGIFVVNDKIGIFDRTNINASYSQKFRFAKDHQIAVGVQGGVIVNRINFNGATVKDYNDPRVAEQKPLRTVYDLNIGVSYKWKALLIGFSVPNVLQPDAKYITNANGSSNYGYVRHFNMFAQYKISLFKGKFNITPTVVMRQGMHNKFQADATLMLDYKNLVFAGAGYRNSFGIIGMAGVNILDRFTIAYAYDHTTQRVLKGQVGATHEITAGFHIPTSFKRKKRNGNDLQVSADSLFKSNDSLGIEKALADRKLRDSKLQIGKLKNENEQLERTVDSLQSIAAINSSADNATVKAPRFTGAGEKNGTYKLDRIYFNANEYVLLPESRGQLDELVEFMKTSAETEIIVKGYADNTGGDEYNLKLSTLRAEAVTNYLVQKGIVSWRIASKGYGNQNPVSDNNTEEGRKENRRVEFTIVK